MAMNPRDDAPQDKLTEADEARLRLAAAELRDHSDERWVEIADRMLISVLRRQRPSHPIRAESRSGGFHVSEQVLVTTLQHVLDHVAHCEITDIHIHADRDIYTGVTILMRAQYPYPLIPLADQVRDIAHQTLADILSAPPQHVTVEAMHVHIEDVTKNDPKRQ